MSDLNDIKAAIAGLSDDSEEQGPAFSEKKKEDPFKESQKTTPFQQKATDPSGSGFVSQPIAANIEASLEDRERILQAEAQAAPMPQTPEMTDPFPGTEKAAPVPPAPGAAPMPPAPEMTDPFPGTEKAVPMPPAPEVAPMPQAPEMTDPFPGNPGTSPAVDPLASGLDAAPAADPFSGTSQLSPPWGQSADDPSPVDASPGAPFAAGDEPVDPFPESSGYLPRQEEVLGGGDAVAMPGVEDPLSAVPEINPEGFVPLDNQSPTAMPPAVEDYVPAYSEISESDAIAGAPESLTLDNTAKIEPKDILLAISVVDPASDIEAKQEQALQNIRSDVSFAGKKKKPPKITTTPLPLDLLVPGTPLIGTIYSPSGGVGKSSTAMNLAVYIAAIAEVMAEQKRKKGDIDVRVPRVLVLDGDIAQGSLALRLKGEVSPSIHTLQLYLDDRIAQGFEGENAWPSVYENAPPGEKAMRDFVMWNQKVTNLDLLAAPEEPDFFFDFGPGEYRDILRLLSRFYDVIIIDSGTEIIQESQRAWLQHAHEVFIITAPEIDRMYNASKATRYIARKRPHPQDTRENAPKMPALATKEKLSLVVTRADADSGLDVKGEVIPELFPWFDDSQKFYVPDVSQDMLRANNSGEFLVLNNPEYAEIISSLAEKLFARYAEMREKRSIEQPQALRQEA